MGLYGRMGIVPRTWRRGVCYRSCQRPLQRPSAERQEKSFACSRGFAAHGSACLETWSAASRGKAGLCPAATGQPTSLAFYPGNRDTHTPISPCLGG